jgi:hypothetical protein
MRSALVVGSAAFALLLSASPTSAESQTVIISNRPVAVTVPARRVVQRGGWPRVIVVARIDLGGNRGRGRGHGYAYGRMDQRGWRARGYRPVAVYYVDGRYYDRWDDRFRGRNVRQEMVYERGGRYYRDWDDDRYDSRNDRYDTRNDRYETRNDRYDTRNDLYDRRDGRSDDRNRNDRDDRDDRGGYDR